MINKNAKLKTFLILLIVIILITACERDLIVKEVDNPQPLSLEELSFDFLDPQITASQLEEEGKYMKKEISEDEMYAYYTMENYTYAFTTDERHWQKSLAHRLAYIEIFDDNDGKLSGPREIKIGDDFESVVNKIPQEKKRQNGEPEFYGEYNYDNPDELELGSLNRNSDGTVSFITLVPKGHPPFIKIHFMDNVVERMILYYSVN